MDKQIKQNFIQLPLNTFKKRSYPIPHFLLQTKLQRSPKNLIQIKNIIQSQDYQYICQISQDRNIFCCKQKTNDKLVVIQVKQVGNKNKCIYLSINLTNSLKKQIKKYFMLKNWKIMDKISILDQKGNGVALLQYDFVQMNLKNFIKRQTEINTKLPFQKFYQICKNLIENLCYYHLQSIALIDIRPQMVVLQDGKWFILNGDHALINKSTQFGSSVSKPVNFRPTNSQYLSPLMYQSYVRNDISIIHNPYKSDVYSLGLTIWQLSNIGVIQSHFMKQVLQNRKDFAIVNAKQTSFDLRQKIIIQNNRAYLLPNVLKSMLQQSQENRNYIVKVCFYLNFTDTLFTRILVPFDNFFKKQIYQLPNTNRKKIQYHYMNIQYEGDTGQNHDQIIKQGRGAIYYNNQKIYQGQWLNNLPNGKCSISFSSMWSYQGQIQNGMLHGQGSLSFNGLRVGGTKWMHNLDEDIISPVNVNLQKGYYFILPKQQHIPIQNKQMNKKKNTLANISNILVSNFMNNTSQKQKQHNSNKSTIIATNINYQIYYQKIFNSKTSYILNLMLVSKSQIQKLFETLFNQKYFLNDKIHSIKLYESISYERYNGKIFDLVRVILKGKNIEKSQSQSKFSKKQYELICSQETKSFPPTQFNGGKQNNQVIDLIVVNKLGPFVMHKLLLVVNQLNSKLSMNQNQKQQYNQIFIDVSQSKMSEDQFKDILNSGIPIKGLNISKCEQFSDNTIKNISFSSSCQKSLNLLNISHLKISDKSLEQLVIGSWLKNLHYLNISYCTRLISQKIAEFLCDEKIMKLQILQIAGLSLTHRGLQKIIKDTKMNSLKKLNIGSSHQIGQVALLQFIRSSKMSELKVFQCFSTIVKDVFLESLAQKQNIPQFQQLNLSGSINISVFGLTKFFMSKNSQNIKILNLSNLDISDEFIQLISIKNFLNPYLSELNLSYCYKITDKSMKQLLRAQKLQHLKKINLSKTNISNDTLFILSQASDRYLQCLKVSKCTKMNDTGFQKLIYSPAAKSIKKLDIGGTSVKSGFFTSMANQKSMLNVQQLSLNQCLEIDQKSFCFFLSSKKTVKLRYLNISTTKISGKALQVMSRNPYLRSQLLQLKTQNCPLIKREDLINICIPNIFQYNMKKKSQIRIKNSAKQLSRDPILLKMTQFQLMNQIQQIQSLFESNYILNLTKLQIKWQQCSQVISSMSKNLNFNHFKQLSLYGCKFTQSHLVDLIKSSAVKNLQSLNLSWTDITNETLLALSTSQFITSLRTIDLSKCTLFNDKGLVKFLNSTKVIPVQILDLRSTLITNVSLQNLGKSKTIKSLSKLILRSCPNITQLGFKQFISTANCSALKQLDIGWTRIGGSIFTLMTKSKNLTLSSLKISGLKGIQYDFLKYIQSLACASLIELQMNYTQLSANFIANLTYSKYLQSVQNIELLGQDLYEPEKFKNFLTLLQSSNMTKLKKLKIVSPVHQKIQQTILQTLKIHNLSIEKLTMIGANINLVKKYKSQMKKWEILTEQ